MPPWYADSLVGHFANDRNLSAEDIRTIAAWVGAGAPAGAPETRPKSVHRVEGWSIGQPEIVFEVPSSFHVPVSGIVPYQYAIVPTHFKQDTWVRLAEVRPGDQRHVHHIGVSVREPDSRWLAGEPDYEVDARITLHAEATLVSLLPRMHWRGKSFEFRAVFPDGRAETLLRIPHYSSNWQLSYYLAAPLRLPPGTMIECSAHFDNSAANPVDPDPAKAVRFGPQSWDEMMIGYFEVATDPKNGLRELLLPTESNPAAPTR